MEMKKIITIVGSSLVIVVGGFFGFRIWALKSGTSLIKQGAPTFARGQERLKLANKLGSDQAGFTLGMAYWDGTGVEKDFKEAMRWLLPAADAGHLDALAAVGMAYRFGDGVERDEKKAQAYFRKAADEGQVKAMALLAEDLLEGTHGEKKNEQEAFKLAKGSAEKGDARGMHLLGRIYISLANAEGPLVKGVQGNPAEGLRWIEKAAIAGNSESCYVTGAAYLALPKKDAANMLANVLLGKKSFPINFGSVDGTMAALNVDGQHFQRDLQKAKDFLMKAVNGYPNGPGELLFNNIYMSSSVNQNPDQSNSIRVLEQLTEAGDAWAPWMLCVFYTRGIVDPPIAKDPDKAMKYLRIAASRGNKDAKEGLKAFDEALEQRNAPIQVERLGIYAPDGFPRIQGLVRNTTNVPHNARVAIDLLQPNGTLIENYSKTLFGIAPGQAAMIDIAIAPYHRNAQVKVRSVEWQ